MFSTKIVSFIALAFSLLILFPNVSHAESGAAKPGHKLVLQASDADTSKWNEVLVNAKNVQAELGRENVKIEIVVFGRAIDMLRIESVVGPRVAEALESGVKVIACQNSMRAQMITPADMLPDITYATAAIVYLMEKQEEGYAYVRP
ncbi:MAG: DsrE family protein [Sulfurimicrobium sp.]|nr:DsrE family protein [Sulfurimicrobium sp.]MDZ7655566.1 DsrE family protein [Sulfurimicrobium sp.]